jgi:ABC-2 type transport system ATP-binding protein
VRMVGEQARVDLAVTGEPDKAAEAWRSVAGVSRATVEQGRVLVLAGDSNAVVPLLFERAAQLGFRIGSVEIKEPNLETVFLALTGRALRD